MGGQAHAQRRGDRSAHKDVPSDTEEPYVTVAEPSSVPGRGALRFARYAFMPNHLGYCGSDDDATLLEYATEGVVDQDFRSMLASFAGAMPYLRFISSANGIEDPFDERVVEAYWLGNDLLERVEVSQLYDALRGDLGKRLETKDKRYAERLAPAGAKPHHNFHVFDVFRRIQRGESTLESMDRCRISWGRVVSPEGADLLVDRRPLVLRDGGLALGESIPILAVRRWEGRGFSDHAQEGDWVALHWNWVCEVISERQVRRLAKYTHLHMRIASAFL